MNREETILITKFKVRPRSQADFATWREKMNNTVAAFYGFVSLEMQPSQTDPHLWTSIQRFQTEKDQINWKDSKERADLIEELKPYLLEDIQDAVTTVDQSGESVTEVFVTQVTPGMQSAYRAWAAKIQQIESQFPGYQGVYIQAPHSEESGNWITILRFDTHEHLDAWLNSDERKTVLKESEAMVATLESHRVTSPFAGWFANMNNSLEPPSIWKQAMLVLLVLFPVVMLEIKFLNPLTQHLNTSLATFIGLFISVGLVTWPLMPIAIYCLKWWLSPGKTQRALKNCAGTLTVIALYALEIFIFWHLIEPVVY